MRETHLSIDEMEKYIDTSDLSEEYLLWMEEVSEHVLNCQRCQQALQKAMLIESISDEWGLQSALELAAKEEEIRRNLLIAKLQQMQEQARMAEVVQRLTQGAIQPLVMQRRDLQRRAGVARGETGSNVKLPQGVEITAREEQILVKVPSQDSARHVTVLLDRKGLQPEVREAVWNESEKVWTAEFTIANPQETFEIYVIE